ncbi:MAG TPA: cytochrome c [Gammaproteobacteria bacterium]|nr:cytochrome c [Gammaproteobacteria bacterium]
MCAYFLTLLLLGLALPGFAADVGAATVTRGQYLTRLADCRACHTQPGRAAFAGGVPIKTPFGAIYTPNITPDKETGIGAWSFDDFYRAMHLGLDENGDYLYPAFPFPAYTRMTREDVKAIWNYLQTVEPVQREDEANTLRWPYSMRSLMGVWRQFYFQPGTFQPDPDASAAVNRGAYLVRGVAHCGACHTPRNRWGATMEKYFLAGGSIPVEGWYPPNITPNPHVGIGDWSDDALKTFLTSGRSEAGAALGPMRDVVQSSLQYLNDADLNAIVAYLKQVPAIGPEQVKVKHARVFAGKDKKKLPGEVLYGKHCAGCHGDEGRARHDYFPDLHNNPIVLSRNPTNLILIMLQGGFEAATEAHPYPHSMPPFGFKLSDKDIAHIANYVRRNWDNRVVPQIQPRDIAPLR